MSETMVERVARAIAWLDQPPDTQALVTPETMYVEDRYMVMARAAIEFLRRSMDGLPRYSDPVYDDIGMQEDAGGDWIKLSDLDAALSPNKETDR